MNTKLNKTLIAVPVLIGLLTGCQGGAGGDSAKTNSQQADDKNKDVAVEVKTADIKANEKLKFVSHREMTLVLDLSEQSDNLAYLSVYSNYSAGGDAAENSWVIDYDSRILGSSLTSKNVERELVVPQHHKKLLVQVWFYDASKEPLTWEVEVSERVVL